MAYELKITADGSPTLYDPEFEAHLHSLDGAVGESRYVFLAQSNLEQRLASEQPVRVLEVGFGTGLNFTLARELLQQVSFGELEYFAFEPRPVAPPLLQRFYEHVQVRESLKSDTLTINEQAFTSELGAQLKYTFPGCHLTYYKQAFPSAVELPPIDVVFYDAYGPNAHPELWGQHPMLQALKTLRTKGVLVTFSVTGHTKRILKAHGYPFDRPEGFGRKREMLKVYAPEVAS
ncbi:MAG: tRNA (5-methylaminomethyl-2-thiouridine)(34)-methyltransferase MnmD [Bacteroidota bacterium]